jgi:hypothetical protein
MIQLMCKVSLGLALGLALQFLVICPANQRNPVSSRKEHISEELGPRLAAKFDEFVIRGLSIDDVKARLDEFYDGGLASKPGSLAYVILYKGRYRSSRYSLNAIRNYMILRGFPSRRIRTINGGYRDEPSLELWVVPKGSDAPKPTPTYRSKRKPVRNPSQETSLVRSDCV